VPVPLRVAWVSLTSLTEAQQPESDETDETGETDERGGGALGVCRPRPLSTLETSRRHLPQKRAETTTSSPTHRAKRKQTRVLAKAMSLTERLKGTPLNVRAKLLKVLLKLLVQVIPLSSRAKVLLQTMFLTQRAPKLFQMMLRKQYLKTRQLMLGRHYSKTRQLMLCEETHAPPMGEGLAPSTALCR
jgi:hypothetical protein